MSSRAPFRRRPEISGLGGLVLAGVFLVAGVGPGAAQEEVVAELRGQVLLRGESPLAGARVVLHEVGRDSAGALDSLTVGPDGRFVFRLPAVPDPEGGHQMYFASSRYRDVLYFGPAIAQASQLDSLYRIAVYDTVAAPPGGRDFTVAVRNVFLESSGQGWQVTDVFQIRNESDATVVSVEGRPVWAYPLPPEATEFRVGQGDLAPDAVSFDGHVVQVAAPVPPGERLYIFRYLLPALATSVPTPGVTERLELLVREPAPELGVEPLVPAEPVELEPGSTYRRFAARGLEGGSLRITAQESSEGLPMRWVAVGLGLVLLMGAGVAFFRTRPSTAEPLPAAGRPEGDIRQALIMEIARLDEAFAQEEDPDGARREAYQRRRRELKERLRGISGGG